MKMKNDLISIIVPTFNGEKYIKECIDSILNQKYTNLEIIVVIDGSTDNTKDILNTYSDKRLKVFFQRNKGVSAARNLGIDKSSGKFLTFVDDDDFINEDYIFNMYQACLKNDWDVVKTGYSKFSKKQINKFTYFHENELELNDEVIKKVFLSSSAFNSCCMMLIKKNILEANELYLNSNIGYAEDFLFSYTLLIKCNKCGWINDCGYNCRINLNSNSRTGNIDKQFKNINDALEAYQILFNCDNENDVANKILFIVGSQLKAVNLKNIHYKSFSKKMSTVYSNPKFIDSVLKLKKNTSSGNMKFFVALLKKRSCLELFFLLKIYNLLKNGIK